MFNLKCIFLYIITILFFQKSFQISHEDIDRNEIELFKKKKKNKCKENQNDDDDNDEECCPESCLDCCNLNDEQYCYEDRCVDRKESIDELQIAAQIGLTLVLIIGILILLMILRRACRSSRSDRRYRRNRRRWPWRRQNIRRHNNNNNNNNNIAHQNHHNDHSNGDFEYRWRFRRDSLQSHTSERTLPPTYEDTRFIHLEKPPTYEEALQLSMAIPAQPPPSLSIVQQIQETVFEDSPSTRRRRFGCVRDPEIGSISSHIRQQRIGPPMEDGDGIRSDLAMSTTSTFQKLSNDQNEVYSTDRRQSLISRTTSLNENLAILEQENSPTTFEEISTELDEETQNEADAWLNVLRIPPAAPKSSICSSHERTSVSNNFELSPEIRRNRLISCISVSEIGTISRDIDQRSNETDNNYYFGGNHSDESQMTNNENESWLNELRIPSVHKSTINSREGFEMNLSRISRDSSIESNNEFQEINLRIWTSTGRILNSQANEYGESNNINRRNDNYQSNNNNNNNNQVTELQRINQGFENEGFEFDA